MSLGGIVFPNSFLGVFLFPGSCLRVFLFPDSIALLWRAGVIRECRVSLAGLLAARLRSL